MLINGWAGTYIYFIDQFIMCIYKLKFIANLSYIRLNLNVISMTLQLIRNALWFLRIGFRTIINLLDIWPYSINANR